MIQRYVGLLLLLLVITGYSQTNYRNWHVVTKKKEKVALIVANSNYTYAGKLFEPVPSAKKLERVLRKQNIDVEVGYNLDRANFLSAISSFAKKLKKYKFGMIFYLGHGFQIEGENYLIPVDANPETKLDVESHAINVEFLLRKIHDVNKPKVVLLDACRNNPFAKNWTSKERSAVTHGMGSVDPLDNSAIFFTTGKNTKVRDDNPYLHYFMNELQQGGCLDDIIRKVNVQVKKHTNREQVPVKYGSLDTKVCFTHGGHKIEPTPYVKPNPNPPHKKSKMLFVQGGIFKMGKKKGFAEQTPEHSVTVSSFYIGKYEVTQEEYVTIMGTNPSHFKGENRPVESVSWWEAIRYCNKRSEREGRKPCYNLNDGSCDFSANGYRLPTEAEWEYAAMGGRKSRGFTYSGSNRVNDVGWYGKNSHKETKIVGSKKPNELGLYDMSGNVWEWCNDWYGETYYRTSPHSNPTGPDTGHNRVLRGGSWGGGWGSSHSYLNVKSRNQITPSTKNHIFGIGFRVVYSQ